MGDAGLFLAATGDRDAREEMTGERLEAHCDRHAGIWLLTCRFAADELVHAGERLRSPVDNVKSSTSDSSSVSVALILFSAARVGTAA